MDSNRLTNLPDTIGNLTQLKEFSLDKNRLTSLPNAIGNLTQLKWISLVGNMRLEELPISLGQLPKLTYLDSTNTLISQEQIAAILRACKAFRNSQDYLISHMKLWLEVGEKEIDLPEFLKQLTDGQQITLNEWLVRLEKTKDFKYSQKLLAATVCDMLPALIANDEFKEFFFLQAEANNTACEDRAGMSLNEIYTYWKICGLPKETSMPKKLEIIASAAKTFTLRKAISQIIEEHQKKPGNVIEREAVEIYLYYETHLREKLNLLSAIRAMAYSEIGQRNWIDVADLEREVEAKYKNELVDIQAFKTLIEQEKSFTDVWDLLHSGYAKQMNRLHKDKASMKEGDFVIQNDTITKEREDKWKEIAVQWFESQSFLHIQKRAASNFGEDQQKK